MGGLAGSGIHQRICEQGLSRVVREGVLLGRGRYRQTRDMVGVCGLTQGWQGRGRGGFSWDRAIQESGRG